MIAQVADIDADSVRAALACFDKIQAIDNACLAPVIAVVGAFSRGKSALINALIGLPLLPVHPLPTTALPTRLYYAETATATIVYSDRDRSVALDMLLELTLANTGAPLFAGATELCVGCPSPLLASGLVLLDTPGIDAPDSTPLDLTGDVAGLIAVFSADPPLSAEEIAFFARLASQVPLVFWVQTRTERLSAEDLQTATTFNQAAIAEHVQVSQTARPVLSVSASTGTGLDELTRQLAAYSADDLRQRRYRQQLTSVRDSARPIVTRLNMAADQLDVIRNQLTAVESTLSGDLEEIRAGTLATLAHLSEYVLGTLSEAIYRTNPAALSGLPGMNMADDALRRVRDQLHNEVERALLAIRHTAVDALSGPVQPAADFPPLPKLALPDPVRHTVPIRVSERRRLRPKQVDADQTVKAYRTAVMHMCDTYAAELTPWLENAFDLWQAQMSGWFTDQRNTIGPVWRQITDWATELAAWL